MIRLIPIKSIGNYHLSIDTTNKEEYDGCRYSMRRTACLISYNGMKISQ